MPRVAEIAADMKRQAGWQGRATRTFSDGLTVAYVAAAGQRILTLSRPVTRPTDDEILRWHAAFDAPLDAPTRDLANGVEARWATTHAVKMPPGGTGGSE